MNFHFDHKKLSYFFYGLGFVLAISILLAISGNRSFAAAAGNFLFSSFSFPSFYLPFFLIIYGHFTNRNELYKDRIIVLSLSVIPFLTVSILFRLIFASDGTVFTQMLISSMGKIRASALLALLTGFEIFLLYFLPRFFSIYSEEEHSSSDVDEEPAQGEGNEENAFREYAFRFPDPEADDFASESKEESIEDIFASILSGGGAGDKNNPPLRPTPVEPVKEEDPFESLESPFLDRDPAIDVLADADSNEVDLELTGQGDYTYHKSETRDPQDPSENEFWQSAPIIEENNSDSQHEAEEKMTEIIAELDNVLSAADNQYETFPAADKPDDVPEENGQVLPVESLPDFAEEISANPENRKEGEVESSEIESVEEDDSDEYDDSGYIVDKFDELDEFRDISSKLAPVDGEEGGVLREVKPKQAFTDNYNVPVEGVLAEYPDDKYSEIDEETRKSARVLEITLEEFKISAKVTGIKKGPVITMFELLPAPGVKISKITNLADNIALRLAASRVRIVAPIPGKHAVGIEVPNKRRAIVSFSEMVKAPEMKDQDVAVPIVLGKDIRGGTQVIDLTRTPHLLIAGATGSGKSVCVNSLICSILYERSPADVKMILVDPKIVELKLYNDIPHLLTPVITDPKKAIQAIQWCLYEMERRYALLDALGVREIRSYNKRVKERNLATTELPYLILVIDEFADLMATSGKELEAMIARLAAMSRAVGIHLVLATQRPSADVITGLIKANFPSRVAFMVASMMDSRIIIDSAGAEKLLGKGDMLFTSAWDPFPSRVQGAFMSEEEVERVVAYVKTLGAPEYIDDEIFIDDEEDDEPSHSGGSSSDPLFNKALEIVGSAGKASASYLQRRLKIGYNRAARLVEQMEEMGIVGPQNGSKPREVIHMPESSNYQ